MCTLECPPFMFIQKWTHAWCTSSVIKETLPASPFVCFACAGLWIHAPVAPTPECVRLVKELGGPVEHIVLPTYAYEHKAFVGPFSRAFPKAKVGACVGGMCLEGSRICLEFHKDKHALLTAFCVYLLCLSLPFRRCG